MASFRQTLTVLGKGLALGLLAVTVLASAGCSSTARRVPVPYAIELSADERVNPDANGRPSPIQITIYELSSSTAFGSRDFFALQSDAQGALGKELLNTDQMVLRPGETKTLQYPGSSEARMVGIVAAYRDLEQSQWRLVVELPEAQNTNMFKIWQFSPNEETIKVAVQNQKVVVTDRDRSWWPF
jgi:type VI secretion system protein VasD